VNGAATDRRGKIITAAVRTELWKKTKDGIRLAENTGTPFSTSSSTINLTFKDEKLREAGDKLYQD